MNGWVSIVILGAAVLAALIVLNRFLAWFQTSGPNVALIISGKGEPRVVVGGRAFVLPLFNQADRLSLEVLTIDVHNRSVYTAQGISMDVDGVAQVAVRNDEASIRTAARQFLGRKQVEVAGVAQQTMEGHLRSILGQMTVEEIYKEREKFAQAVQQHATTDMQKMGLNILSFTLRDVKDNGGYLEALGKPRLAAVKRDATIAEAEAKRDSDIAQAVASRASAVESSLAHQESEVARLQADTKVAEAERDYKLSLAQYQELENVAKAKSAAAFDIEAKNQAIVVQEREASRVEKELDATVRKPAEANRFAAQVQADGAKYRAIAEAEARAEAAKIQGIAAADAERARGLAEADNARAKGLAEAEALKAKGLAEAEAMERKAEAFQHYNDAAVGQMFVEILPRLAEAMASPLAKANKVIVMGGNDGASRLTGEVVKMMAQLPPLVEALSGLDVGGMMKKLSGGQPHTGSKSAADGSA